MGPQIDSPLADRRLSKPTWATLFLLVTTLALAGMGAPSLLTTVDPIPGPDTWIPTIHNGFVAGNVNTDRIYWIGGNGAFTTSVGVFDVASGKTIGNVDFGRDANPQATFSGAFIAVDDSPAPSGNKVYVAGTGGPDLSSHIRIVDGERNSVVMSGTAAADIPLSNGPLIGIAVNSANHKIYTCDQYGRVCVVDGTSRQVVATLDVPLSSPDTLIANPATNKVYVFGYMGGGNTGYAVIGSDDTVLSGSATLIPTGVDSGVIDVAVDPGLNKVYALGMNYNTTPPSPAITVVDGSTDAFSSVVLPATSSYSEASSLGIDTANHTLYVGRAAGGGISVVHLADNSVTKTINRGARDLFYSAATGNLFLVDDNLDFDNSSATRLLGILNPTTETYDAVPVAYRPFQPVVDPLANRIYVADEKTSAILVIDGTSKTVISTLQVGSVSAGTLGIPKGIAVAPALHRLYVGYSAVTDINTGDRTSYVDEYDTTTLDLVRSNQIESGSLALSGPLAVDESRHHLFYTRQSSQGVGVLDTVSGTNVTHIDLTGGCAGIAVNPASGKVYVTGGASFSSHCSVINAATFQVLTSVDTVPDARIPVVNSQTNKIYVPSYSAESAGNDLTVIDGNTDTVETTLYNTFQNNGDSVYAATVNPLTNRLYVSDQDNQVDWNGHVTVFDLADNTFVGQVDVERFPFGIAVMPDTQEVYVANNEIGTVSVIQDDASGNSGGPDGLSIVGSATSNSDPAAGATVRDGDVLTYTLLITNSGSSTARSLQVVDLLPAFTGLDNISRQVPPARETNTNKPDYPYLLSRSGNSSMINTVDINNHPAKAIRWNVGDLAPNAQATVSFAVKITNQARLHSSVFNAYYSVASSVGQPAGSTDGSVLVASAVQPVYSLSGTVDTVSIAPGGLITYTLSFTNHSVSSLSKALVTEQIPDNTAFVRAAFVDGTGQEIPAPALNPKGGSNPDASVMDDTKTATQKVTWFLGTVAPGATAKLKLVLQAKYDLPTQIQTSITNFDVSGQFKANGTISAFTNFDSNAAPHSVIATGTAAVSPPALALAKGPYDDPNFSRDNISPEDTPDGARVITVAAPDLSNNFDSEVTFLLIFRNEGASTAAGCYLKDRIPDSTKYVGNSAFLTITGQSPHKAPAKLQGDHKTLIIPLGDLPAGASGYVTYRVKLSASVTDTVVLHPVGSNIGAANLNATPEGQPLEIPIEVRGKPALIMEGHQEFAAELLNNPSKAVPGYHRYYMFYMNAGSGAAKNVQIEAPLPDNTQFLGAAFLSSDAIGQPGPLRAAASDEFISQPVVNSSSGTVVYHLGKVKPRESGYVQLEVIETNQALTDKTHDLEFEPRIGYDGGAAQTPMRAIAPSDSRQPGALSGASSFAFTGGNVTTTHKLDPNIARTFVHVIAPRGVQESGTLTYTVLAGNLSNVEATSGLLSILLPVHTTFLSANVGSGFTFSSQAGNEPRNFFANFDRIPAHSVIAFSVTAKVDAGFKNDTLRHTIQPTGGGDVRDDGYVSLESLTAPFKMAPVPSTYVFSYDGASDLAAAFEQARQQIALASFGEVAGSATSILQSPAFMDSFQDLTPLSVSHSGAGADMLSLQNNVLIIPLGGGNIVASGGGNLITNDGASIVAQGAGNIVAQGAGNLISAANVSGFGTVTAASALVQAASIVAQGGGNILNVGGQNLITNDGGSLVDNTVASIISNDGASLTGQNGASLQANQFNNLIAGASNLPAMAGIISNDGASLITNDGGSIISNDGASIISTNGAGILSVAGGSIARNAGNLVGNSGGTLSAMEASRAVSISGAGTMISVTGDGFGTGR